MTGTYSFRDNPVDIKDLKVDGNNVSFKIEMSFNDRQFTMEFKGKVEGKTLKTLIDERGPIPEDEAVVMFCQIADGKTLKGEFITQRGTREAIGKKVD